MGYGQSGIGMIAVFFVYGLAFFLMGFAILGEVIQTGRNRLTTSLLFLALFGLIHSAVEWADMFELVARRLEAPGWEQGLKLVHSILLPLSLVPLIIFGVKLLADSLAGAWSLWLIPPALIITWLTVAFLPLALPYLAAGEEFSSFLARWQEAWARYLLYLPGSLMAAIALALQRRVFLGLGMRNLAGYATLGVAAFALNSVLAGLIVPPAPFPPAYWINRDSFIAVVGLPPQLFRALAAVGIAFAVVQMLRFFDLTQRRLLENARQEALQLQQQARLQAEEWGRNLEQVVKERTEQLGALAKINTDISSLLEIDQILGLVAEKACQLLKADLVAISLAEGGQGWLTLRSVVGNRTALFSPPRRVPQEGVAAQAAHRGEVVQSLTPQSMVEEAEGLESQMAVPLRMGGRILGALLVASRTPTEFTTRQAELLSHLANQVAIALENARLYQQVQDLAIVQERERIAREMHDSLAQVLGYLRLELSRVTELVSTGELAAANAALEALDRTTEAAYADVRDSILGLRTTAAPGRGLLATLRDYLHTFTLQHQIEATLLVEPGSNYHFSPRVEVQLVRVIQEAMTNVRKHARASRVVVRFQKEGDGVRITVEDNGRGFDPSSLVRNVIPRFGLATMRERAESVGGKLVVDSAPGTGTRVTLWVPASVGKGVESYEATKNDSGG